MYEVVNTVTTLSQLSRELDIRIAAFDYYNHFVTAVDDTGYAQTINGLVVFDYCRVLWTRLGDYGNNYVKDSKL